MRAYQIEGFSGIGSLKLVERPDPTVGRGQILVRIKAASLNYRDLLLSRRRLSPQAPDPIIPLSDGAGEVVAVGDDVSRFKVGDRVCSTFFGSWDGGEMSADDYRTTLGGYIDGVLSELFVCDEGGAVKAPDHLSYEQAACLPCAALTAWSALTGPKPVAPGQTVLTLGTGGVSTFAMQFAKAAGARVIATSSSDEKLVQARTLGAAETINYRTHPDWEKEVLSLTDGRGVDHVIELGGGGTIAKSIASTAIGGTIHLIGVITSGEVDPLPLMRWKTLRGVTVGSRRDFEAMNRMLAFHRLEPVIDQVFPFEQTPEAFRKLEAATHVGKIVIRVAG